MFGCQLNVKTGETKTFWDVEDRWRVICEMERDSRGSLVIAQLRIVHVGALPTGGLTASILKRVHLGSVRNYAALNTPVVPPAEPPRRAGKSRGRPKTLTRRFYQRVWNRYHALLRAQVKHPAKALAAEYEDEGFTRTGIRSVLRRCRVMHAKGQL